MYIKENDFKYFDGLYKGLDEERRKKFLKILLKAGSQRSGEEEIKKIQVVGDEIFDVQAIAPEEFITRTMIKKAYKTAKREK
ncbi:MAG: hypothetical protein M0Z52_12310 [Actinomycetota bacterium]|nr:hypothetical protein [Nitrospiraceae bacterium]MDA8157212.1 hypothetical protein [Actinomycetota bacterium]